MKKFLPFVFPGVALILVLFLAVRWYNSRTVRPADDGKITQFGDGVQIEDLSKSASDKLRSGAKDEKSVELTGADNLKGEVRYDITDGKVNFSVTANLPEIKDGQYQVWLKQVDGEAKRKAFVLTFGKGGYMGSAAISADLLPFQVIVSKETKNDDTMETSLLTGTITK
jgi:hypothetical protein